MLHSSSSLNAALPIVPPFSLTPLCGNGTKRSKKPTVKQRGEDKRG